MDCRRSDGAEGRLIFRYLRSEGSGGLAALKMDWAISEAVASI